MEDEVNTYEDMINLSTNINEVKGAKTVTALYDFEAFQDDEISFRKNDRFKVYEEGNSSNSEWCSAEHLRTGKKGYIPWAYVTNNMSSLESMGWWFNVDAYAAEQLLLLSGFPPGTFVLRPTGVLPLGTSMCALSMLYRDSVSDSTRIAHYRIRQHLGRVFISANREFKSISELLDFYKAKPALKCKLRGTVSKHSPIVYPRQMEVGRKSLGQMVPLECGKYRVLFSGKLFDTLDVTVAQLATEKMTSEEFREAAAVLRNFRDSKAKIVRMIAVSLEPESYLIVLGETIYCTLKEHLKTNGNIKLNLSLLFQYAAQVADGMAFLERNNVVHGYLRADCVFVCYPYAAKIAHPKLHELISGAAGNRKIQDLCESDEWKWTAPEAINDERKYCVKSDVWSYGILLYELITFGEEPYNGLTAEEALSLLEGGTRLQRPDPCPLEYYVTMLKCWHKHPECRPTFEFLRELFLDFENIEPFEIGSKVISGIQSDSQPTKTESTESNVTIKTLEQATNKSEDKQGRRGFCAKALYSFEADDDDEISLKKDDVITDVDPAGEGWWIGTTPECKRGMFPSNYVDVLEGKESDSHPLVKTQDLPIRRGLSVKALFDYVAERDDEISICKDDILTDVDPVEVVWWKGTAPDGKRGMFPSTFVEVFEDCYAEITKL